MISVQNDYGKVDWKALFQAKGLLLQKALKKIERTTGADYLKYLAD